MKGSAHLCSIYYVWNILFEMNIFIFLSKFSSMGFWNIDREISDLIGTKVQSEILSEVAPEELSVLFFIYFTKILDIENVVCRFNCRKKNVLF